MNPSPDQEGGNVLVKAVQQIRPGNQQKRCLDIIIIKDPVGKAGQITDPGVSQGIEAGSGAGDEVQKKPARAPTVRPVLLPHIRANEVARIT